LSIYITFDNIILSHIHIAYTYVYTRRYYVYVYLNEFDFSNLNVFFLFQIDSSTDRLNVYASFIFFPGYQPTYNLAYTYMRVYMCMWVGVPSTYWDECFISDSDISYYIKRIATVLSLASLFL